MSQPPQFPSDGSSPQWGSAPEPDGYGQQSASSYGQSNADGQSNAYGQSNPYGDSNSYGQSGSYGQSTPYGQGSPSPYGQASTSGYGPSTGSPYGQQSANSFGQAPGYSSPGGSYPAQQPPEKKSRWWLWTCLGCAILAVLALVGLGGCVVLGGALSSNDHDTSSPTTSSPTGGPTTSDAAPSTDSTQPQPAAQGGAGSKDNPFPINGGPATLDTSDGGTIDLSLGTPNWDAWDEIRKANSFNDAPPDGQVYVLVPVTVTYHGSGSATPWVETRIRFSADNGQIYDTAPVVTPHDSIQVPDLTDGGSTQFDVAIAVPADQVQKGKFIVEPLLNMNDQTFYFNPA